MPQRRHEPVRTCVGCRLESGKPALVRVVRGPDGAARIDPTGRAHGRGAYVHASSGCIELARRRGALERSLKASVPPGLWASLEAGGEAH
jgi:predicted RNA-binding protein YlxR (DUF448 family)